MCNLKRDKRGTMQKEEGQDIPDGAKNEVFSSWRLKRVDLVDSQNEFFDLRSNTFLGTTLWNVFCDGWHWSTVVSNIFHIRILFGRFLRFPFILSFSAFLLLRPDGRVFIAYLCSFEPPSFLSFYNDEGLDSLLNGDILLLFTRHPIPHLQYRVSSTRNKDRMIEGWNMKRGNKPEASVYTHVHPA